VIKKADDFCTMEYFFDTSAFIKALRVEAGSAWVLRTLRDPKNHLYVSRLVVPESFSVLGRLWRAGQLTQAERDTTAILLLQLIRHRRMHVRSVTNQISDAAGHLALTLIAPQYPQFALRALDATQLATAVDVRQAVPHLIFACADARLITLAQIAGQQVIDPTAQP